MNKDVRRITDGALMAAIIGMLLLVNRQTGGLIEATFLWILPMPMLFYSAKYGCKNSLVVFTAMILLTLMLGTPQTIFYVGSETLIGLVYGSGIYTKTSTTKLIIRTIILACIADIFSALVFASFFGYDLQAEITEYTNIMNQVVQNSGTQLPQQIDVVQIVKTVIIVSVVLMGVLEGLITHLLGRLLLKRLRIYVAPIAPLESFYPPKWSGYLGLAGAVLFFYCTNNPLSNETLQIGLQAIGMAGVLYLVIFGIIGISIYLRLAFQMRAMSGIIAIALALIANIVVLAIGFLYICTDMHERIMKGVDTHAH